MIGSKFKQIGIMGRITSRGVKETLSTLIGYLETLEQPFLLEKETASTLNDPKYKGILCESLNKICDLLIVIGGDGSLLQAAHAVLHDQIPVLGINRGRLGFLTDIHPTDLPKIKAILLGNYRLEQRFLLSAKVFYQNIEIGQCNALNEVALIPDSTPHMYEFEIYIDDQFVCSQDSDGVIIATPTGSTAYALSGGGPILHPSLDAIVIVPMFPHTLSLRPLVIEGDNQIKISISHNNSSTPRLTADGQSIISTPPGSVIQVQKKSKLLKLIHPNDYDYYETLRTKLHWGRKLDYVD